MLNNKCVVVILGLKAKLSEALRPKSRQHWKVIFWNWDPTTIWHHLASGQFFPSRITPPYCTEGVICRKYIIYVFIIHKERTADFWGRSPGFESGISFLNDTGAEGLLCTNIYSEGFVGGGGVLPLRKKIRTISNFSKHFPKNLFLYVFLLNFWPFWIQFEKCYMFCLELPRIGT